MCPTFSKTKQYMQFGTFIDSYKHTTLQWTMSINSLWMNCFSRKSWSPVSIQFNLSRMFWVCNWFLPSASTNPLPKFNPAARYIKKRKSIYMSVLPMKQRTCFSGFISINIECQNMIVEIILDSPLGMLHYQPQILQEVLAVHRAWQVGRSSAT